MNRKTRCLWSFSFLFIFVANMAGFMLNSNLTGDLNNESADQQEIFEKVIMPSAGDAIYHILGNNWSSAVSQGWCSGSGTESDPYIIRDLVIDGQDLYQGIIIENSTAYFTIQDCEITNIGGPDQQGGIELDNASNGNIINNHLSSNLSMKAGIRLSYSNNNLISGNFIRDCKYGIYLYEQNNYTTVYNNIINSTQLYGIQITNTIGYSYYNNITQNTVNNGANGIRVHHSYNTTVSENVVFNGTSYGIYVLNSNSSNIISNIVHNNTADGLTIGGGETQYGVVENNHVYGSLNRGITVDGNCKNVQVIKNTITENGDNAIFVYADDVLITRNTVTNHTGSAVVYLNPNTDNALIYDNYFIGNTVPPTELGIARDNHWNSSTIGNYWDDYGGNDIDNNGIGDTLYNVSGQDAAADYFPIYGNPFHDRGIVYINGSMANGTSSWSWVVSRAWCLGTGAPADPYVIEDLVIDASGNDYGIQVDDSDTYCFKIENCTVSSATNAGVLLNNSNDGTIDNCDLSFNPGSSNGYGLKVIDCNRTTTTNTRLIGNSYAVSISNSDYTNFSYNRLNTSFSNGMSIYDSDNNTISNNYITDTKNIGLWVVNVESTNITSNIFGDNGGDPSLYMQENNYFNYIYNNTFGYNTYAVLAQEYEVTNVNHWNNSEIGNVWYDYNYSDIDDDGIGDNPYQVNGSGPGLDYLPIFADGPDAQGGAIFINAKATGVDANNWTWAESQYWCTGSGTEEDPYVISGYYLWDLTIDGQGTNHSIEIRDSEEHFRIVDCNITNSGYNKRGLELKNVSNGIISNCDIQNNGWGVYSDRCRNLTFTGNNMSLNINNGLLLALDVINVTITDNTFSSNEYGMTITNGFNCIIENNIVYNNSKGGLSFENSEDVSISNNEVFKNGKLLRAGIFLLQCTDTEILHNEVFNNSAGIKLYTISALKDTRDIIISKNNVTYNNLTGIDLENDDPTYILRYVDISENNVSFNGIEGITEAGKAGIAFTENYTNNSVSNNYIANNTGSGLYMKTRNSNNSISNNEIVFNEKWGIMLQAQCNDNTINENNITGNKRDGIYLLDANKRNNISNNYLSSNVENGLAFISNMGTDYNTIINNTATNNGFHGIYISTSSYTRLINNTCTTNLLNGIFVIQSDSTNITECTSIQNILDGILVENSIGVSVTNNTQSFSFNGRYGIHFLSSNNSYIFRNHIEENDIGIVLNWSEGNVVDWNIIKNNPKGILEENGVNVIGANNIITGEVDEGNGGTPGNGTPPEPPGDFMIVIIIGIIIGAVAVVGGVVAKGRGTKDSSKVMKELREEEVKVEEKQKLKIKVKQTGATPPPVLPKGPKKAKKAIEFEEEKQVMTQAELQELQKTEGEVAVEKKEYICVVHKGPIEGDIYLCPKCHTLYCVKCANTLKDRGEKCWSCETEIKTTRAAENITTAEDPELKKQAEIKKFDVYIQQAQAMVQKLDIKFGAGEISTEEYMEKKTQLAEKIGEAMAKRDQLND